VHSSVRAQLFCAVVFASLLASAGCRERVGNGKCNEDADCGSPAGAFRCEARTGVCYCRTNDACLAREFCNPQGFCQDRAGCETNADCTGDSLFCDTAAGACLSLGRCTSDLHCDLGQVCDLSRSTCVDGCRTSGDCPGSSCRCGEAACACNATTAAELANCTVGVCDPNFCADENFCRFGELCGVEPDAGTTRASCYSDFDEDTRPYCANCTFGGGISVCGTGANYCLIDTANPGNYFCGADCAEGQACPRGYSCQDVIVVYTQWACARSNPACPTNPGLPCTEDKDCKRGGVCAKLAGQTSGFCQGQCGVSEGEELGFCSCQVDADCAQQSCSGGECSISRQKCVNDGDCRAIRCVDFEGGGGCLVGQNCAPADGLSCLQVR
jgi:hypothetical protein